MDFSFSLSTKNFENLSKLEGKNDFEFVVGDQKIKCHKLIAAFISKNVENLLVTDFSSNRYVIDLFGSKERERTKENTDENTKEGKEGQEKEKKQRIVQYLKMLIEGKEIQISTKQIFEETIEELIDLLNNDEMREKYEAYLSKMITKDKIEKYSYKERIRLLQKLKNRNCENANLIEDIAEHFYEITGDDFDIIKEEKGEKGEGEKEGGGEEEETKIERNTIYEKNINKIEILEKILSSKKLKIKSDDDLLDFIIKQIENEESEENMENRENKGKGRNGNNGNNKSIINELKNLCKFIKFEFLSAEGMKRFINYFTIEDINFEIWNQITRRLIFPIQNNNKNDRLKSIDCYYDSSNRLEGIFDYLTRETKGNIYENKTIDITVSKFCCGSIPDIVNFSNSSYCHIKGDAPYFVQIEFKKHQIELNGYTIKTGNRGNYFSKSFIVEVSRDGNQWETVDEQKDTTSLKDKDIVDTFLIEKTTPIRFVKIKSFEKAWDNNNHMELSHIELFGNFFKL